MDDPRTPSVAPRAKRDETPATSRSPRERSETKRLARDPRTSLIAYGMILACIAFWPVPIDSGAGPLLRAITKAFPALTYSRIEFVANIALFIPLGLLLTLIVQRSRWLILPIAFLATVTIECVQAVALGARTPSILDIIANTTGACIGILIAVIIEKLRVSPERPT